MPVYAVTGMVCSGKTTLLNAFRKRGARVFNADRVVHCYYRDTDSAVYRKVAKRFPGVLSKNGTIVRRRLRDEVYHDRRKLRCLESIVHPVLIGGLKQWAGDSKEKKGIFAAEVPLLFEKDLAALFDKVIFIHAPRAQLLARIRQRFSVTQAQAGEFLELLMPPAEKMKASDYVVRNDSDRESFEKEIACLWQRLDPALCTRGNSGEKKGDKMKYVLNKKENKKGRS